MIIDSHQHFWKYDPVVHSWITDDMKVLQQDFMPETLALLLKENDIDGCIAVQAGQTTDETTFLLNIAHKYAFVKGVVGWVDFFAPDLDEQLQILSHYSRLKGFRHIVQAEPQGFLLQPFFVEGVKKLKTYDFTYDILVYHHQLKETLAFVQKLSGQKLIIDHCAKPAIKNKELGNWAAYIKEISKSQNVYCKLSGLFTETDWRQHQDEDFYPYLDVVFEAFGTDRLIFGSDWPVMLVAGSYAKWKKLIENYMEGLGIKEREAVFGGNAINFYRL